MGIQELDLFRRSWQRTWGVLVTRGMAAHSSGTDGGERVAESGNAWSGRLRKWHELQEIQEFIANKKQRVAPPGNVLWQSQNQKPRRGRDDATLSTTSWNTAGVTESSLSCFISQLRDCIPWHVVCLQEAFKRLENLDTPGGDIVYTPSHRPRSQLSWLGPTWGGHGDLRIWGSPGGCLVRVTRKQSVLS